MHIAKRIGLAYGLSLAAAGAVQLVLMLLPSAHWLDRPFIPLAILLLPITVGFAVVFWWRPTSGALGWTAIIMLIAMIVLAIALYVLAIQNVTPASAETSWSLPQSWLTYFSYFPRFLRCRSTG